MAKVQEYYNIGSREDLTLERLLEIIENMYKQLATAINKKPDLYERATDGQVTDTFLSNGDFNLNTTTQKVEMLVSRTAIAPISVTWKTL